MDNKQGLFKYILIVVLCIFSGDTYPDVKGFIKPYFWNEKTILDSRLKLSHEFNQGKISGIIVPVRDSITPWNLIPEYYASIKSDRFGKITIGGHNADILMVDGGTFATGIGDIISEGNHLYSQSLVNNLQPEGYYYKISYLLKRDNFYFSSAYSPLDNTTQARILYANSISASTDCKSSISIINDKIVGGFNIKYLGFLFGGSYGGDFYTAGIGYYIGPFKSSLTYLSQDENAIFGMQYSFNKNISTFLQLGYSATNSKNLAIGVKMNL